MYFVTIQFPTMRGRLTAEEQETVGRVANRLSGALRREEAGSISRVEQRPGEPAALRLSVSSKAFVEHEIIETLGDLEVLGEAAVFYEGPDKRSTRCSA